MFHCSNSIVLLYVVILYWRASVCALTCSFVHSFDCSLTYSHAHINTMCMCVYSMRFKSYQFAIAIFAFFTHHSLQNIETKPIHTHTCTHLTTIYVLESFQFGLHSFNNIHYTHYDITIFCLHKPIFFSSLASTKTKIRLIFSFFSSKKQHLCIAVITISSSNLSCGTNDMLAELFSTIGRKIRMIINNHTLSYLFWHWSRGI